LQQEADLTSKHHSNIASSYVTLNDRAEYCPSTPFCGHVVEVGTGTTVPAPAGLQQTCSHLAAESVTVEACNQWQ
jgi:hypothetical protein